MPKCVMLFLFFAVAVLPSQRSGYTKGARVVLRGPASRVDAVSSLSDDKRQVAQVIEQEVAQGDNEPEQVAELRYCDEISLTTSVEQPSATSPDKEAPGMVCQARNVWEPIPQGEEEEKRASLVYPESTKKALDHEDFPLWKTIKEPQLSDDGKWVAYTIEAGQTADGTRGQREVVVRATSGVVEYRFPSGRVAGAAPAWAFQFDLPTPVAFTSDSQFLLFVTRHKAESQRTLRQTGPNAPVQRSSLAILRLADGELTKVPRVADFKLPQRSGRWMSYAQEELAHVAAAGTKAPQAQTVVLRELASGAEVVIPEVTELEFDDNGLNVAYTVNSSHPNRSGVYVRRLSDGVVRTVLSGPGIYRGLAVVDTRSRLAFLADRNEHSHTDPRYSIYLSAFDGSTAERVVHASELGHGMLVSATAGVQFTPRGNALTFMISPAKEPTIEPDTSSDEAKFQLWHWKASTFLPNGQRPPTPYPWSASASHFGDMTYLSVYHIDQGKWTRLETPNIREVLISDDARHALGFDRGSHALRRVLEAWTFDIYDIDVLTGEARLIRERVQPSVVRPAWKMFFQLSPGGRYCVFLQDDRWWSYDFDSGEFVNFTGPTSEVRSPTVGRSRRWAGTAGWTADHRRILLYDEFDLWAYDPDGRVPPERLTDGLEHGRIYRAVHERTGGRLGVSQDEVLRQRRAPNSGWQVDLTRPLLLEAQNIGTGDTGLWELDGAENVTARPVLTREGKRVTAQALSRNARRVLVTMESFQDFPNLWAGADFAHLSRMSDVNPQQSQYLWGSEELISIKSETGATLRGRLYKPANFDPSRRYPLIVFVYQTEALDMFRRYGIPALKGAAYSSRFVPSHLTSKGYVVLQPDIAKVTGAPMKAAVDAIIPAVQSMIDSGYIDPARIALTGHSFGGSETLYTLTQAPGVFRCAVASAGLSNLVAAYGSQSFGAAMPAFSEKGQLAMGVSPWADPYAYFGNSAIYYADRVATPLLMMHNDQDNAVAYAQGFQFFAALRRLDKEVYLYNYPGEGHNLNKHANVVDWHRRMDEFLDHCLQDRSRPEWMTEVDAAGGPDN